MSPDRAVTIDWLSYTLPWKSPRIKHLSPDVSVELVAERASGMIERWQGERALHGYRWQFVSVEKPGLRVMISPRNHDMGVHIQFAGSALMGENVMERLEFALDAGGSITRIDLAVDVAQRWNIRKMYEAVIDNRVVTRAKKPGYVESETGATCYVGSRTSEKFLRVYDKGGQLKSGRPWTRVELECKGGFAGRIAKFIRQEGLQAIPSVIRGFCDWTEFPAWGDVMNSEIGRVSLPQPERQSNTRGWLLEIVAPALARYAAANPEFQSQFYSRVDALLEGLAGGVG
jgi:hypothetical protein